MKRDRHHLLISECVTCAWREGQIRRVCTGVHRVNKNTSREESNILRIFGWLSLLSFSTYYLFISLHLYNKDSCVKFVYFSILCYFFLCQFVDFKSLNQKLVNIERFTNNKLFNFITKIFLGLIINISTTQFNWWHALP